MRRVFTLLLMVILFSPFLLTRVEATITLLIKAVDLNEKPLNNAYITLVSPRPGAYVIDDGYTNENGVILFQLNNPPDEIIVFVSWKDTLVHESRISPYSGSITLKCNVGDIKVRVLTKSLDPVKGSKVVISWLTPIGLKKISNMTKTDGIAYFYRLPLVELNVSVSYRNKIEYEGLIPVNYTDIYTVLLDLYNLKLRVLDESENPIKGVHVYIVGEHYKEEYLTNLYGVVEAKYLFPGNYTIKLVYKGLVKTVNVEVEKTVNLKVVLPRLKTYSLRIYVKDVSGKPISYIPVTVFNPDKTFSKSGYTDEDGEFVITLASGIYYVRVEYGELVQLKEVDLNSDKTIQFRFQVGGYKPSENLGLEEYLPPYLFPLVIAIVLAVILAFLFHYVVVKAEH